MTLEERLDVAFAEYDDALRAGRFAEVDAKLAEYVFESNEEALIIAVTVLMTTKPARSKLPSRDAAIDRFAKTLEPERQEKIVPYL